MPAAAKKRFTLFGGCGRGAIRANAQGWARGGGAGHERSCACADKYVFVSQIRIDVQRPPRGLPLPHRGGADARRGLIKRPPPRTTQARVKPARTRNQSGGIGAWQQWPSRRCRWWDDRRIEVILLLVVGMHPQELPTLVLHPHQVPKAGVTFLQDGMNLVQRWSTLPMTAPYPDLPPACIISHV
jgi:hypothetical protein